MKSFRLTRRHFLTGTAAALTLGPSIAQSQLPAFGILRTQSPNEKLNIAGIGVGGKGRSDVETCSSENIVALCDVDWREGGGAFNKFPSAKRYKDFRKMLDECKEIDAVTISTPDHMHAYIALHCMNMGKHVYVQKPLAKTVYEARLMLQTARKNHVATQMGNQGAATDLQREACEIIWSGMIGSVREVHSWTDRPEGWWPQGMTEALPEEPVRDDLDWDLWLGTAPFRPFNNGYGPFKWRGWQDFGTGALGDIACHSLSPVVKALQLGYPTRVECLHTKGANHQTYPTESIIRYDFPQRGALPPVSLYWYDGMLKPKDIKGIQDDSEILQEKNGNMFIGDEGLMVMVGRKDENVLVQGGKVIRDFTKPEPIIPRLPNILSKDNEQKQFADRMHKIDWIRSCKTGSESGSNFEHAAPLAEWVVMGDISLKYPNQPLDWDGPNMRFTNNNEANQFVSREFRQGWEIA